MRRGSLVILYVLTGLATTDRVAAQSGTEAKAANWDRVQACRAVRKDKERLRCVDAILGQAAVAPSSVEAAGQPAGPAATVVAGAAPRDKDFGKPPAPASEEEVAQEQDYRLTGSLEIGPSRYLFITETGESWEALESGKFVIPPSKGARMTVKKTALGGFSCVFGRTAMLCRRRT